MCPSKRGVEDSRLEQLEWFIQQGARQVELIIRRVFEDQVIPHHEKIFSLFEPHTEWISKGKTGVPVELGLRVCVLQDQFGFTLHHRVMAKETDDMVAFKRYVAFAIVGNNLQRLGRLLLERDRGDPPLQKRAA